ncbi:conserved hypothetical protein [Aspergillus terreus NIH2624]|uniref:Camp independent regulatory protein n=1 Tax=Aspergillus terreus (strain NIH 2624 / FGSC A1156) TaxID=341663 RepID=Q0CH26_ASPTN|nr:uncharacterized protein ATEG_07016 [Aspergillus terreus NIH2624]EAU32400.1 conserved hypothetical protein [Aspergillus terreus NIH2624]
MVNGTTTVLEPTFTGYVATTQDALILFEACLTGVLHHVPRRPHDRERGHLVRSGSVFIYEENSSGIKRWTDGVTWSPSRILGNFLVYRELEKPFPPGEKKRAMKKANRRPVPSTRPGEPYPRHDSAGAQGFSPSTTSAFGDRPHQSDMERALVGSLVDSYGFKDSGLVKKTMSVTVSGVTHHLVSYYSVEDVVRGHLTPPSMVDHLRYIRPRAELTQKQSFRAPIDDLGDRAVGGPERSDPTPCMAIGPSWSLLTAFRALTPISTCMPPPTPQPMRRRLARSPATPCPGRSLHNPPISQPHPHRRRSLRNPTITRISGRPLSMRNRSHSDQSTYRNSSISSRSVATDATSPMDPTTPATFSRGSSFSLAGLDGTSHQALEQRGVAAFDPSIPRRESNPIAPYYTAADRQPYYVGATAPAAHAGYPVSTWTTAAPAQPQV